MDRNVQNFMLYLSVRAKTRSRGVGDLQSYPAVSFVEQCYDRRFDLAKRAHQIG
jgi:hypothetical protein